MCVCVRVQIVSVKGKVIVLRFDLAPDAKSWVAEIRAAVKRCKDRVAAVEQLGCALRYACQKSSMTRSIIVKRDLLT